MVDHDVIVCPLCGGALKYYDSVKRKLRIEYGEVALVIMRRFKCGMCGSFHREMNDRIVPYKQYDADIIEGVTEGYITSDTIGFEDYPCETTMIRWRACKIHFNK